MPDVSEDLQAAADADEKPVSPDATKDGHPYKPDFSNLSDEKVEELRSLVSAFGKRDQWARMVEIIRCTLRRYFWLGIQHGFWNADAGQMQIGPQGGPIGGGDLNEEDLFEGDFNIYTPNGKIFIAVFSQNAASTRMEPDKPGHPDSEAATKEA